MSKSGALKIEPSSAASAQGHKIRDARYSVKEDRFIVVLDSGKEYSFSRSSIESDDGTEVVTLKLDRKRFFFRVTQASGNQYEVPWDRVLHEGEPSYAYFRGHLGAATKPRDVGRLIRELRSRKEMTQDQLARAAGMIRPNLSRIEAGKHRPTLDTLEKIAGALKVPVADLMVAG